VNEQVINLAATQGIWAVLFVVLLFYILKKQDTRDKAAAKREENYQGIIQKLTEKFQVLEDVKEDVKEIKNKIFK
jgi:Tfp pilus assembly protein PilO